VDRELKDLNLFLFQDYIRRRYQLLFKGSTDGFKAAKFHEKCDNKGSTICFIQSEIEGYVFGGYVSIGWT